MNNFEDTAKEYWQQQERVRVLSELRELWAYEAACGHPVMAIHLGKWVKYCRDAGITEDWWELKHETFKENK